jgi:hypothetical protein
MADQTEHVDDTSSTTTPALDFSATLPTFQAPQPARDAANRPTLAPLSFNFSQMSSTSQTTAARSMVTNSQPFGVRQLEGDLAKVKRELATANAVIATANERHDKDVATIYHIEHQRDTAIAQAEEQKKKYDKEHAEELQRGAALARQNTQIVAGRDALVAEKERYKRRADEATQMKEQAIMAKERIMAGNANVARQADESRRQAAKDKTKIGELETQVAGLQEECRKLEESRLKLQEELRKEQAKLDDSLEITFERTSQLMVTLRQEHGEMQARNTELQERIKSLEVDVESAKGNSQAQALEISNLDHAVSGAATFSAGASEVGPSRPVSSSSYIGNFISPTGVRGAVYSNLSSELNDIASSFSPMRQAFGTQLPQAQTGQPARQPLSMSGISNVEIAPVAALTQDSLAVRPMLSMSAINAAETTPIAPAILRQPLGLSTVHTTLEIAPIAAIVPQALSFSSIATTLNITPVALPRPPVSVTTSTQTDRKRNTKNKKTQTVRHEATVGTQTDFEELVELQPDRIEEPDSDEYLVQQITIEELDDMVEVQIIREPRTPSLLFYTLTGLAILYLVVFTSWYLDMHANRNVWLGANELTRQTVASFRGSLQFQNTIPLSEGPWQLLNLALRQSISGLWLYWGDDRMADYAQEFSYAENVLF